MSTINDTTDNKIVKLKIHVHWNVNENLTNGGSLNATIYDYRELYPNNPAYVHLKELEIDVDMSAINPQALCVDKIKAEKAKLIAETTKELEEMEEKIQQLLAIGSDSFKPITRNLDDDYPF